MSEIKNKLMQEKPTDPIASSSNFAILFYALGAIFAVTVVAMCIALFSSGGSSGVIPLLIGCLAICFNLFLAGHIIQILANIRWFTYKTSEKLSSELFDPLLFYGVLDELKKISEKTDQTNAYLHHIYQNSTKAPPPPPRS